MAVPIAQTEAEESAESTALPSIGALLRMTFEKWYIDNIPRHAAALSYYTLFAVAPLLLLAVEIMGLIDGQEAAEAQVVRQVEHYVNSPETAALVQTILDNALPSTASWWVTGVIVIVLIYGASSVFGELQIVLNMIWGAPLYHRDDIWGLLFGRLLAVIMVIISGLLLVFAMAIANWNTMASDWAYRYLGVDPSYSEWSYFLMLFGLLAAVFALIYKFMPNVTIAWHEVLIGSIATAFLISIARLLISLYLSYSRINSMFGAAGSLVILLLWVYYSAQIFFLGAEFTHVYGRTYGAQRRTQLAPEATNVVEEDQPKRDEENNRSQITHDQKSAEIITAEIKAIKPLELEPAEPVTLNVNNEQPAKPRLPTRVRNRVNTARSRMAQIIAFPIKLTRPLREIVLAVSVIGALSLAALFGIPWRKRRTDETQL